MPSGWKVRSITAFIFILLGVWFVIPNLLEKPDKEAKDVERPWYIEMLPSSGVGLGLDLQGGVHMVLGIDLRRALMNEADQYIRDLKEYLPREKIPFGTISREFDATAIRVRLNSKAQNEKFEDYILRSFTVLEVKERDLDKSEFLLEVISDRQLEIERDTVRQALETLRNRLDEFGVAEPSIVAKGTDRIIVQLPGLDDPERAKRVLAKTAQLEFKLVDESMDVKNLEILVADARKGLRKGATVHELNRALKGKLPQGTQILMSEDRDPTSETVIETPYLLKAETLLTGDMLENARTGFDQQFNQPIVNLRFSNRGAEIFEKVTGENVKKRLAIILDDKVQSNPPVIQQRIGGGRAQITFGSLRSRAETMAEAKDLALVLRAGALPAPVEVLQNRAVGPSLGRDSIERGLKAMLVGALLIFAFMAIYYRGCGIAADGALLINLLFITACLGALGATLTLPGIAGIIISIGMAVDANVIIYSRIREELYSGKPVKAAVEAGYERAHLTILDSNLTTIITAIVLLQFGTGPIKGFAITLIFGLIANYFTALWFTRLVFEWVIHRFQPKRLSI